MLHRFIDFVGQVGAWAYLIIFAGATLEASAFLGVVVPGETLALLGGLLAAHDVLNLHYVLILVCAGAIIGDSIGYELGRYHGRDWLLKHGHWVGLKRHRIEKVDAFFHAHGGKTVLIGRFSAILRALVPFVAGTSGMHYPKFLLFNAIGGIVWGVAAVLLGYFVGASWDVLEKWAGRTGLIVTGVAVAVGVGVWLWRRRQRRAKDEGRPKSE